MSRVDSSGFPFLRSVYDRGNSRCNDSLRSRVLTTDSMRSPRALLWLKPPWRGLAWCGSGRSGEFASGHSTAETTEQDRRGKLFRVNLICISLLLLHFRNLCTAPATPVAPFGLLCSPSIASGVPALNRPSLIHETSFMVVSSPALDTNLSQGRCLSHIGTEGMA